MPRWAEVKARWAWLNDHLADDEPVVFKLPRREARKRIANVEKRKRITFAADEQTFAEFHAERERILRVLDENPTLFGLYLVTCLRHWSNDEIAAWKAEHET
jgi:hypothetical protein